MKNDKSQKLAGVIRDALRTHKVNLPFSAALEVAAKVDGHRSLHHAQAAQKRAPAPTSINEGEKEQLAREIVKAAETHSECTGEDHLSGDLESVINDLLGRLENKELTEFVEQFKEDIEDNEKTFSLLAFDNPNLARLAERLTEKDQPPPQDSKTQAPKAKEEKLHHCVVAATNANGEPDLFFIKIGCSKADFENGHHYECAKEKARLSGFEEPMIAYDETDKAGKALMRLFVWETATIVSLTEENTTSEVYRIFFDQSTLGERESLGLDNVLHSQHELEDWYSEISYFSQKAIQKHLGYRPKFIKALKGCLETLRKETDTPETRNSIKIIETFLSEPKPVTALSIAHELEDAHGYWNVTATFGTIDHEEAVQTYLSEGETPEEIHAFFKQ